MAEFSMERIFRRGFGGTLDPRGRDDRMQFWIHFALVFGVLFFVQMIAQMGLSFPPIDLSGAAPADPRAAQLAAFQAMQEGMATAAYVALGLQTLAALLLLTATARRLHDRGRSGWWSLILPAAVIATGLDQARRMDAMVAQMPRLIEEMAKSGVPEGPGDIFAFPLKMQASMPGPNWPAIVAGVAMLWLAIELLRAGTAEDNRFGPPPA
ncbi:MAG: DUF805 domain-containing protein [Sphingopyxis sp.]|nr:DUF805 domain-containing protein [Sphingopyxis sp.]